MSYEPKNLKRWTPPPNYIGAIWPNYYSAGVEQSQDSGAIERSNFSCMLRELGAESETVIVVRESHYLVGWVEWIAIHENDDKALAIADEIKRKLDDCPIIDDGHFAEVEQEEANLTWKTWFSPMQRIKYIREHKEHFEFRHWRDLLDCVRGEYFAGFPCELLSDRRTLFPWRRRAHRALLGKRRRGY